jgi:segregation and condensation protein B
MTDTLAIDRLKNIVEAVLFAAEKPLNTEKLLAVFSEEERPSTEILKEALVALQQSYEGRAIALVEVASGYRFQVNAEWASWVGQLTEEKPARYSRALLETLSLIAYRQPITRGEIESIRGVAVSTSIIKTLLEEREWVRIVGHKEAPGRPALYATTKHFLDYFGLKALDQLPSLPEVLNLDVQESQFAERLNQAMLETDNEQNRNHEDLNEREAASKIEAEFEYSAEACIESE